MADAGNRQRRISVRTTFVIQFQEGADVPEDCCAGTVEHVASGERSQFSSWSELQDFVKDVLQPGNAAQRD
jgi:hypothetical protein